MNLKDTIYIIFRVLTISGLMFISCKDKVSNEEAPVIVSNKDTSATPVKTALCREGMFEYRIEANGLIKPEKEIKLYSSQNGKVIYSIARTGARVQHGQVILQYDTSDLALKLDRAEIARYNAAKEYESQLISYEKLMADKSPTEVKEIEKKLYISSGFAIAEQEIKEIQFNIRQAVINAPFSGIMANVNVIAGQTLRSGDEILTLISSSNIFECLILESDLPLIHIGQEAEVKSIATPDHILKGKVYAINPKMELSGMAKVTINLLSYHGSRLYSGMHGHAIIKAPARPSLLVPKEAVVIRGNRPVVFTAEGPVAKWNYVEIGRNNGVDIELLNGLKNGDKVIVSNNLQLAHEAVVVEEK